MKSRIGEIHELKRGKSLTIIDFVNGKYTIVFNDGNIRYNIKYSEIKNKEVKNFYFPTVYGVGYLGVGIYPARTKGKDTKFYTTWHSMFRRCYSKNASCEKSTYKNVTICEEWKCFQNFAEWMSSNYNPETMQGWHLDKDIRVKGNKIYSPETCGFVPREINVLIAKNRSDSGECPRGVWRLDGKFVSEIIENGKKKWLGTFSTPEEAFQAYKVAKEGVIKRVAKKWKSSLDEKMYESLYNYKIEITD